MYDHLLNKASTFTCDEMVLLELQAHCNIQ